MSVGYLAGAFDMLNVRDLDVIRQAAGRCDRLVVGVYSDEYAAGLNGRHPVVPLSERLMLLQHVRGIAEVIVHPDSDEAPAVDVRFAVDGEDRRSDASVIVSTRHTTSAILRAALAPVDTEAVA